MINFNVTPLFPVPLYNTNLGPLEQLAVDKLHSLEFERMPSDNGDYTVNKNVLKLVEFSGLQSRIQTHIDNLLYEVLNCKQKIYFEIQNSWINRHGPDDWAKAHRHSNSLISGVYYIDVDDQSGSINFEKDRSFYNLWTDTIEMEYQDPGKMSVFNADAWSVLPKNNDLLLFPSLLYHSVHKNKSNNIRYSLAFNVFPRGNLGGSLSSLKI
jgi:uncharacterized protein (TIGR02466 family)